MNTNELLEIIINVTALSEKWLMWSETELPDQAVYVPSIFQMRDAFSHTIKMLAEASLAKAFVSDKNYFLGNDSHSQLQEIYNHVARSFLDCADHIIVSIQEEARIDREDRALERFAIMYKILNFGRITVELRKNKSDPIEKSYQTIESLDKVLQAITTLYRFASIDTLLQEKQDELRRLYNKIEHMHEVETIKNYDPSFFTDKKDRIIEIERLFKTQIKEIEGSDFDKLPEDLPEYFDDSFLQYFESLDIMNMNIVEDICGWQDSAIEQLSAKNKEIDAMIADLSSLDNIMSDTSKTAKVKRIKHVISGFALSFVSAVIAAIINNSISAGVKDNNDLLKFLLIFVLVAAAIVLSIFLLRVVYIRVIKKKT